MPTPTGPLALYDNRLRDAAPVASTTAADYNVLNLRDMRAHTFWSPTALPATVTVDCGSAKVADYAAIYGHDLGSKGVTVEVRKSTDNFAANDVLVDTHTPADDLPILRLFTNANSRYLRFKFTGAGAMPIIAIASLGAKLEIPEGIAQGFDPVGFKMESQANRSIGGHALGKVILFRAWAQQLKFEFVSWTWVRDTWKAAAAAWLDSEPWLFAWNPDTYPKETYHVMTEEWSAPHRAGSLCDLILSVSGVKP